MASRIEAFAKYLLRAQADSLCMITGEKIYVMRGSEKLVVGREALSEDAFTSVANEVAPGESVESLAEERRQVVFEAESLPTPIQVEFGRMGSRHRLTLRSAERGEVQRDTPGTGTVTQSAAGGGTAPEAAIGRKTIPVAGVLESAAVSTPAAAMPAQPEAVHPSAPGERRAGLPKASDLDPSRPIDRQLLRMVELDASDLHLSSGCRPMFRIHGEMKALMEFPVLTSDDIVRLLDAIIPDVNRREFGERNDSDFAYEIESLSRFRVNVFRDRKGVGAVFRQIPVKIRTAQELNLPPSVVGLGSLSKGLVLVTGPTGSGKSTTLAAIIDHINETRTDHIITIEDPIEFVHPNKKCLVNQREIGTHTRGFKDALRAALREDPDIVLVGEMRDLETISIALETAETGHLVFGTLHTTTAASTVDRIIDQFPEDRQAQIRVMLSESMRGVVAQTLLKRAGGGRIAALEILLHTNAVANLIRDGKTFQLASVMQTARGQGMVMLNDSLLDLVKRKLVEPEEAYAKAVDKSGLVALFTSNNLPIPDEARRTPSPQPAQPDPVRAH